MDFGSTLSLYLGARFGAETEDSKVCVSGCSWFWVFKYHQNVWRVVIYVEWECRIIRHFVLHFHSIQFPSSFLPGLKHLKKTRIFTKTYCSCSSSPSPRPPCQVSPRHSSTHSAPNANWDGTTESYYSSRPPTWLSACSSLDEGEQPDWSSQIASVSGLRPPSFPPIYVFFCVCTSICIYVHKMW